MSWLDIFRRKKPVVSTSTELVPAVLALPEPQRAAAIEELSKAQKEQKPKRWTFDPHHMGWTYAADVPSEAHPGTLGLDYGTLMTISRISVIGAIIQTRIQQVAEFGQPQPSPYSVGFKMRLRDQRKEPTRAEQREMREIGKVLLRAGGKYQPGGLDVFLRMLTRDSLTYDQANFEPIFTKGNKPWGFVPADAGTIRRARPTEKMLRTGQWDPDKISYVQVVESKIVNEYARHEMAWGVRRPRSWIYANGYGYPELEELLAIITDLMNAQTFNSANFRTGVHAQNILVLQSSMDDTAFRAFQRSVVAMLHGPRNSKRTPVIQLDPGMASNPKEDLKAINMSQSNKDMEYSNWINWLLKVACACYQMDPAELGFLFGNEGQSSALNTNGPAERIWASKERGLRPLLRSIQQWLNDWIVYPLNDNFAVEFVGFDSLSESAKLDLDTKAVRAFKSVNEVRAEHDLDPLEGWIGDMILDPTFFQAFSQMRAEEQQEDDELFGEPPDAQAAPQGFGEPGQGQEQAGPGNELGQQADQLTRSAAQWMAEQSEDGRLMHKSLRGRQQGARGKWVPVPTRDKSGTVRAYVVEVD